MQCFSLVVALLAALVVGGHAQRNSVSVDTFTSAFNDAIAEAGGFASAEDDFANAFAEGDTDTLTAGDGVATASVVAVAETENSYADVIGYTDTSGPAAAGTVGASAANEDFSYAGTDTEGASAEDGTTYTDSLAYAEGEQGTVDSYSYMDSAGPAFAKAGNEGVATEDVSDNYADSLATSGEGGYGASYSRVDVEGEAGDTTAATFTYTQDDALAVASAESFATEDETFASANVLAVSNNGGSALAEASATAVSADK